MNEYYIALGTFLMMLASGGILGSLFWSLHQAKIPLEKIGEGWIETRRSPFDHVIGILKFVMGILLIPFGLLILLSTESDSSKIVILMALGVVMGFLFIYSFCFSYLARIRFNSDRIEYQALNRKISVSWNNVSEIKMSTNGPKIQTSDGNFHISNTRRGFFQLLETAENQGVKIQNSPYLKTPSP